MTLKGSVTFQENIQEDGELAGLWDCLNVKGMGQ